MKVSDEQVQKQLEDLKKQYFGGDEKKYLAELKRQCVTDPEVRKDLRANLLSNAVFKKVTTAAKVTEADDQGVLRQPPRDLHDSRRRASSATSSSRTRRSPTSSTRS